MCLQIAENHTQNTNCNLGAHSKEAVYNVPAEGLKGQARSDKRMALPTPWQ